MKDAVIFLIYMMIAGVLLVLSSCAHAAGSAGFNYETYAAGGASPSRVNRTILSSGITASVNYSWGSGNVLDSGRSDGVIVHLTGYFKAEYTGIYSFGTTSDDGTILTIGNQTLVNCWCEQGDTFRSGSIALTAGSIVPVEIWYYENGGGATLQFWWYNGNWQIVPTSLIATNSTYWVPPLGLGASSATFSANSANVAKINTFVTRTTADSKVTIEQIGNFNVTTIEQTGTKNNNVNYRVNGSNNATTVTQKGINNSQTNYADIIITGNSNTVDIKQRTSSDTGSFIKGAFVNITNNNNSVTIDQQNSGSHYAEVNLSGGNKTVNVSQTGSAGHMASITLSGAATGVNLTQQGSTQQFYSVTHNCATPSGCGAVTVTQGQ